MKQKIITAALLHDIGKLILRADPGKGTHSQRGVEFLKEYMPDAVGILRAIGHHHASDLKQSNLSEDDISYLVYEADNIASSSDRRENESDEAGFNKAACLENIFNVFSQTDEKDKASSTSFPLRGLLEDKKKMSYPLTMEMNEASSAEYSKLMKVLANNFYNYSPAEMSSNELLQIVEATMCYVPSSTARGEVADISLYDHQKLTAALASCMYDYFEAQGIRDYKSYCYGAKQAELRATDMYLLVSGDLSGIQNFIYTIPSKGALKSLRGRSFYLELLLEHLVDELLEQLELSRCNLLYTGGGNFYLLLPNTDRSKQSLQQLQEKVNNWFLQHFGNRLYLAMGWSSCSANDFKADTGNALGILYQRVRNEIAKAKHSRYNLEQLNQLFDPTSIINKTADGTRECGICHNSSVELTPYADDSPDTLACSSCRNLKEFGNKLLKHNVLVVIRNQLDNALELPGLHESSYILAISHKKLENNSYEIKRIYVKNEMETGRYMATRLWMGDYVTTEDDHPLEFEKLARLAGGSSDADSINRLGVMRADVDNLGAAFMAGFDEHYATLGRSTALSRQLSIFFKQYINSLCGGNINGYRQMACQRFSLFGKEKEPERKVHIIYSGGDDMFLVGAWDELIELAVDIREAFRRYTNDKLTFSAGIGFFDDKCPISEIARATGALEEAAKSNPGKDSLALFGTPDQQSHNNLEAASYNWQEFTSEVCGEKLAFIKDNLGYPGNEKDTRLTAEKSLLYRLLELLRDNNDGEINIARFAYTIARLEPAANKPSYPAYQKVRQQFYNWYQDKKQCRQLVTALELVIYSIRAKGE